MLQQLSLSNYTFPPVSASDEEGLLAFGGDLRPARLLEAYRHGIFPWYTDFSPILWWSPDPRLMLKPSEIYISKSMRKVFRENQFSFSFDHCFKDVMLACASTFRAGQEGTWITRDMLKAYIKLHEMGYAHSLEVWDITHQLVGGLYGLAIGKAFFGESMFHHRSNASKAAMIMLARYLEQKDFHLIDAQQDTEHMRSLGAYKVTRSQFLEWLDKAVKIPARAEKWNNERLIFAG